MAENSSCEVRPESAVRFESGRTSNLSSQAAEVDATLQNAGINLQELKKTLAAHGAQIDAILARNDAKAHSLGMRGINSELPIPYRP